MYPINIQFPDKIGMPFSDHRAQFSNKPLTLVIRRKDKLIQFIKTVRRDNNHCKLKKTTMRLRRSK